MSGAAELLVVGASGEVRGYIPTATTGAAAQGEALGKRKQHVRTVARSVFGGMLGVGFAYFLAHMPSLPYIYSVDGVHSANWRVPSPHPLPTHEGWV